eukprot:1096565-Rhodomonas_salina.3
MDETMKAGTTSFAFTMTTPGLGFVLEDDYQVSCARRATDVGRNAGNDEEIEELLYADFQEVHVNYTAGPKKTSVHASVGRAQIDNMFDPQTSFPVIASIAPADNKAFMMTLIEKVGEVGVDKYFESVLRKAGALLIKWRGVVDHRSGRSSQRRTSSSTTALSSSSPTSSGASLSAPRIAVRSPSALPTTRECGKSRSRECGKCVHSRLREVMVGVGRLAGSDSRQTFVLAAQAEGQGEVDAMEVEAGLGEMQVLLDAVVKGHAVVVGSELEGVSSVDPFVYVHLLEVPQVKLHLWLMLTEGNEVIRQYAGPLVSRVLRNMRVEDIVIKLSVGSRFLCDVTKPA